MDFKESLKKLRSMSDEEVVAMVEKATGKALVSYEGLDALIAALMGFYNGELKKKSPTGHKHAKEDITNFPSSMPPTAHTHDDRYYTESEINNKLSTKVNTSDIVDNLTDNSQNKALSARQGKILNDNKLDKNRIVNDLVTNDSTKVLSASMGKKLGNDVYRKAERVKVSFDWRDKSNYAIGIVNIDNTNIGATSYFSGILSAQRMNGLYCPLQLELNICKAYNKEDIYISAIQSGVIPQEITPCTFTYKGKKYGGLNLRIQGASHYFLELIGSFNGTHTPICIPYEDYSTGAVLEPEIKNSMKKKDFTFKDVYHSGHIAYDSHNFNPNSKLNTLGGTISGALTVTGNIVTNGSITLGGYTITVEG